MTQLTLARATVPCVEQSARAPATAQNGSTDTICAYSAGNGGSVILTVIPNGASGASNQAALQAAFQQIAGSGTVMPLTGIGDAAAAITNAQGIKGFVEVAWAKGSTLYGMGGLVPDISKLEDLARTIAGRV